MYDHILVPLKGDRTDEAVVVHTAALAKMSGGKVTLFRVIHSHSLDETAYLEELARKYLERQVARLLAEGVTAEGRVAAGEPAPAIVQVARELEVDLVVMASHGHREVWHLLMGSVTEDVIRNGFTPVLVVRP